jgi:undecaprenyl-diphosphatase
MTARAYTEIAVKRVAACDMAVCGLLNGASRRPAVRNLFAAVSRLGDGWFWYGLMILLPLLYGQSGVTASLLMLRVGILNYIIYKIVKELTGRHRPCAVDSAIAVGAAPLDQYSFPSGHTMHAVAFTLAATAQHGELAWMLVPFAALVALSRMILGLHYPTDVIAGGVIGALTASWMIGI